MVIRFALFPSPSKLMSKMIFFFSSRRRHTRSYGDWSSDVCSSDLSGPLLDRIDIHVDMPAVQYRELRENAGGEASDAIRDRVIRARRRQLLRYQGEKIYSNAQMSPRQIRKYCNIPPDCERLLESAMTRLGLSVRAHDRILKVARTIADLEAAESIGTAQISEAIQYRSLDRNY